MYDLKKRKKGSYANDVMKNAIIFMLGFCTCLLWPKKATTITESNMMIQTLQDAPLRSTSHEDPTTGRSIMKQQLLEPWKVPTVAGFSVATIRSGEEVSSHKHEDMWEFFYVLEGNAVFESSEAGDVVRVEGAQGTFVTIPPHVPHAIHNPSTNEGDVKMAVFGVVPDCS